MDDLVRESNPGEDTKSQEKEHLLAGKEMLSPWRVPRWEYTGGNLLGPGRRLQSAQASPVEDGEYPLQYCTTSLSCAYALSLNTDHTIHASKQPTVSKEQLFNLVVAEG